MELHIVTSLWMIAYMSVRVSAMSFPLWLCHYFHGICLNSCTVIVSHKWKDIHLCSPSQCCQRRIRGKRYTIATMTISSTTTTSPTTASPSITKSAITPTNSHSSTSSVNRLLHTSSTLLTKLRETTPRTVQSDNTKKTSPFPITEKRGSVYVTPQSRASILMTSRHGRSNLTTLMVSSPISNTGESTKPETRNYFTTSVNSTDITSKSTREKFSTVYSKTSSSITTVAKSVTSTAIPATSSRTKTATTQSMHTTLIAKVKEETITKIAPLKFAFKMNEMMNDDTAVHASSNLRCGVSPLPQLASPRRVKRIAGGTIARRHDWPWMVALKYVTGLTACGGSLISRRWVVTAAHCLRWDNIPLKYWRVRVGEYSLSTYDDTERDLKIKAVFRHPKYRKHTQTHTRYDIALIQLSEDAPIGTAYCDPICLPPLDMAIDYMFDKLSDEELFAYDDCWTIGWGYTLRKGRRNKYKLRQVKGKVNKNSICSKAYKLKLDPQMICFGEGNTGPCRRDSGGPLMCRKDGRFYLVGVTSFGADKCGSRGYPAVFTRVASFLPWIMEVLQQKNTTFGKL